MATLTAPLPSIRPLGWLGMLLYPLVASRLSGSQREVLELRRKLTVQARERQQAVKGINQILEKEADLYADVLVKEWYRLGEYYAQKWRDLDGGPRRKKVKRQLVKFERRVSTPEAHYFQIMTGRTAILGYRSELPHKVRAIDLIAPDTLKELTAACKHPVTAAWEKSGVWVVVHRNGNTSAIPKLVTHHELLSHHPEDSAERGTLILGVTRHREVVAADLEDYPHLLIAGASRSGKSNMINNLLCQILRFHTTDQTRLILIDPKRLELSYYKTAPHLHGGIVYDVDEAIQLLEALRKRVVERTSTMEGRARKLSDFNKRYPLERMGRIVVVVDEMAALMRSKREGMQVKKLLTEIANMGRAVGIHLVLCTQLPIVDIIPSTIKVSMWVRMAGQVNNADESRVILGTGEAAKLIQGIHGRMVIGMDATRREVQTPLCTDDDVHLTLKIARGRRMGWITLDGWQPVIHRENLLRSLVKNPLFHRQLNVSQIAGVMKDYAISKRQVQAFVEDIIAAQTFTVDDEQYRIQMLTGMAYIEPDNEKARKFVEKDEAEQAHAAEAARPRAYPLLPIYAPLLLPAPKDAQAQPAPAPVPDAPVDDVILDDDTLFDKFLAEKTRVNWRARTLTKDLYEAYCDFAERLDMPPLQRKPFSERIGKEGFRFVQIGRKRERGWQGIELLTTNDLPTSNDDIDDADSLAV